MGTFLKFPVMIDTFRNYEDYDRLNSEVFVYEGHVSEVSGEDVRISDILSL